MKKVVVTGGAGFIGSHLSEELVRRGYHVIILDDLSTGKMENIEALLGNSNAEFVRGSVTDSALLHKLFQNTCYVFHQAAIASVVRSIEDPKASHEVNINGTLNVLSAALDNGVKKVVYASSASVYGDTPSLPQKEDMLPGPQSPYAVTKLTGEYYCQVFHKVYGLPTVCLRYFNVFGPRQDANSQYSAVIPLFITRALRSEPLAINGDGEQTRDFVFIKDVVKANILAAGSAAAGVFNIAQGESTSINRLAGLIIRLTGNDLEIVHRPPVTGDIRHSLADISLARTFGYEPEYSLDNGVRETIGSFQYGMASPG